MIKRRPEAIKDVVAQVIGALSSHQGAGTQITSALQQGLTDKERRHVAVAGVKEGTVFLDVDSPAWLFQLNLKRTRMLKEIQKDNPQIQKIFLKTGKAT